MTDTPIPAPAGQPARRSHRPPWRVRAAVRLFPASWREHYEAEFAALLEVMPFSPGIAFDVLVAAVDAHLDPTGPRRRWPLMIARTRRSELAVLAAWVLFVVAGLAFQRMTEGLPFAPLAAADLAVGLPFGALVGAAVVSLGAVAVGGVPIAAAIALSALRTGRRSVLGLLAVPPIALATWLLVTALLLALGPPTAAGGTRIVLFLVWVGSFVLAAVASTVAVSAAALRAPIDGGLYERAARPAVVAAVAIVVGAVAVAAWGGALLADHTTAFWGFDGLVSSSTALTWLGIVGAMAVAASIAVRAAIQIRTTAAG